MLPNWIGIGPGRAGTTTIYEILKFHPEVFMPAIKECNFLHQCNMTDGDLAFYESSFFDKYSAQKAVGEISPCYFISKNAQSNILKYAGKDTKFIVTLRHPVRRAFSDYRHSIKNLSIKDSFPALISKKKTSIYEASLFGKNLRRWYKSFPKENFLILIFEEDIEINLARTIERICTFLNISPSLEVDEKTHVNRNLEPTFIIPQEINPLANQSTVEMQFEWADWSKKINHPSKNLVQAFTATKDLYSYQLDDISKSDFYKRFFKKDVKDLELLIKRDLSKWEH